MTTRPFDTGLALRTADNTPPVVAAGVVAPGRKIAGRAAGPSIFVAAGAASPFVFVQRTPATTWSIRHQFRHQPQVQLQAVDGRVMYGAVRHLAVGWVEATFSEAVAGRAVLT